MASQTFAARLNEQIGNELSAHVQYLALAAWYDNETLPNLAAIFYTQAREEHDHAMMMVQYLIDNDVAVAIPAVPAPRFAFADLVEPVGLALEQEQRVTAQISDLSRIARDEGDLQSERFMDWFLKEQTEEVAKMRDLLTQAQRGKDSPLQLEQVLAPLAAETPADDPTAPPIAGGAA
jgi:bacterioferritin B